MARRHRRSRAEELDAHVRIGKAAAELCTALIGMEPQVPDFMFARKVLLDITVHEPYLLADKVGIDCEGPADETVAEA